jgi:hypothetical protein
MEELQDYMNENYVVKDATYNEIEDSIKCLICMDIIIDPMMCTKCKSVFCKNCIEKWHRKNRSCPIKCKSSYEKCKEKAELLSKLQFECKKCKNIINYDEMSMHFYSDCNTKTVNKDYFCDNRSLSKVGIFEKVEEEKMKRKTFNKIKSKKK